jgi:hypothetical protein
MLEFSSFKGWFNAVLDVNVFFYYYYLFTKKFGSLPIASYNAWICGLR